MLHRFPTSVTGEKVHQKRLPTGAPPCVDRAPIFVGYNPNARDHTIRSAYSVRGGPEATVSTPLTCDEVAGAEPADFTIATVPARFAPRKVDHEVL